MKKKGIKIKGRGASYNTVNRFEKIEFIPDEKEIENSTKPKTTFYSDTTKSIITYNESPDIGFEASINPYRGCEHGCVYCYARPTHEYLDLSAGLDFETKIFVKENADILLKKELSSKKWKPQPIAISGVTDCYQPAEKHFKITRKCLETLLEFKNPVGVVTKNFLITRDIDILSKLAEFNGALAVISITTLDPKLARLMEPRTSQPYLRLKTIEKLSNSGIPTMVLIAPVIPGLTDHEIPKIIESSVNAGAVSAAYVMLRLPYSVKDIFTNWLDTYFPERRNKVINRIKAVRGGKLNNNDFFKRQIGEGIFAEQVSSMFKITSKKFKIDNYKINLNSDSFKNPNTKQLKLL